MKFGIFIFLHNYIMGHTDRRELKNIRFLARSFNSIPGAPIPLRLKIKEAELNS